jgi:hypothetical protein
MSTVRNIYELHQEQFIRCPRPITDTLQKNKLPLFSHQKDRIVICLCMRIILHCQNMVIYTSLMESQISQTVWRKTNCTCPEWSWCQNISWTSYCSFIEPKGVKTFHDYSCEFVKNIHKQIVRYNPGKHSVGFLHRGQSQGISES